MPSPDTILIFEKPEAYFFPHYSGRVFAPFGVPQPGFRYLLYKVTHLLHLPCCSLFWGEWKARVKTAKRVIIFDYGYQRGMEQYVRRVNPDCQVFLFFWNKVNRYNQSHLRFSDTHAIFSTDPEDCRKYGLKYHHIFYPRDYYAPYVPTGQNRLFFLGVDKGRAPYIASLKQVLEEGGLDCDIRVFSPVTDRAYRKRFREILTVEKLPYSQYLAQLRTCNVLLDVNQAGQSALTMRVMESLYLSKKLITGNRSILTYDFYDPNNIFVLPGKGLPTASEIQAFLRKPFRPYPDAVLDNYSFDHWLDGFTLA